MGNRLDIPVRTKGPMNQVTQFDVSKHAERLDRLQAEVVSSINTGCDQTGPEKKLANNQAIADAGKIVSLIESKFKNQLEFEKSAGVYNTALNRVKSGNPIRIDPTLVRIAKGLGVETDDLILFKKVK